MAVVILFGKNDQISRLYRLVSEQMAYRMFVPSEAKKR